MGYHCFEASLEANKYCSYRAGCCQNNQKLKLKFVTRLFNSKFKFTLKIYFYQAFKNYPVCFKIDIKI